MLWETLQKSTRIVNAYEHWKEYREQLTQFLIEEIEIGDEIAILGAGACNDIDLKALLPYISHIKLIDCNKEALEEAVLNYGIPEERVELVEWNVWDIDYTKFEEKLNQEVSIEEVVLFLEKETKKMIKQSLPEWNVDVIINIGLYSQLNALLASMFYIKREPYSLSEREQMNRMLSYMNQESVKKINDWIFAHSKRAVIGYEYAVFETNEKGNKECQELMWALNTGQIDLLDSMKISRVEGGWQGESDLARRYRQKEIRLCLDRYFLWNFIPQKQYIMQCYVVR